MTLIPENKLQLQTFLLFFSISPINSKNKQMNFPSNISVSNKKLDAEKNPNPGI